MCGHDDVIPTEMQETITTENLVTGVLEECFREMDDEIRRSLSTYDITGGCICLVVLIMLGKVYVANAGDCRAILVRKKKQRGFCFEELSQDHNPITDSQRVQSIAYLQSELLGMFHQGIIWDRSNVTQCFQRCSKVCFIRAHLFNDRLFRAISPETTFHLSHALRLYI